MLLQRRFWPTLVLAASPHCRSSIPQNLALNVAEKGFSISVYNRSYEKTEAAVKRAQKEGLGEKLRGFEELKDFVMSLERPRWVCAPFRKHPPALVSFPLPPVPSPLSMALWECSTFLRC